MQKEHLTQLNPDERLSWALQTYALDTIALTMSGKDRDLLYRTLEVMHSLSLGVLQAVFVDTLLYSEFSPQTLDYIDALRTQGPHNGYVLHTFQPTLTLSALRSAHPLWDEATSDDFKAAQFLLKQEPLDRAFHDLSTVLWISGARNRREMPILRQREDGLTVLYPLADMSQTEIKQYRTNNHLEINEHYLDYLKVLGQGECGIHTFPVNT